MEMAMKRIYIFILIFTFLSISENSCAQYYASEQQRIADDFQKKMKDKESYITMQSNEMIDSTQEVTKKFLNYLSENKRICSTFKALNKLDDNQLVAIKKFNDTIDNVIPDFVTTSSKKIDNKIELARQSYDRYCPAPEGDLKAYIECVDTSTKGKIITQLARESLQYRRSALTVANSSIDVYNCVVEKKAVTASSIDDLNNKISAFLELMKKRDESVQNTASKLLN
jgi:hypothetical protein